MLTTTTKITRINGGRNGRHYRVEGFSEPFPSVTTVLGIINKPALVPWARNMALESVRETLYEHLDEAVESEWVEGIIEQARRRPDQIRDQAADFGTQAHILIEQIIQGLEPEIPAEMEPVVQSFTTWRQDAGLDIQLTETMVYSGKYSYAGSMDAVAYRSGQLVALDWKTSNGLYPEHLLQVAAYAKALEEMSGESVTEAWAVRFGKKEPEFEVRKVADLDTAFNAFRAALYLWRTMKGGLV